jgi:hypothetical protein
MAYTSVPPATLPNVAGAFTKHHPCLEQIKDMKGNTLITAEPTAYLTPDYVYVRLLRILFDAAMKPFSTSFSGRKGRLPSSPRTREHLVSIAVQP